MGDRIKKVVPSKFMGTMSSVFIIFYTGYTYSCSSYKGDFWKLEDKMTPRNMLMHTALRFPEEAYSTDIWKMVMDYYVWVYDWIPDIQS